MAAPEENLARLAQYVWEECQKSNDIILVMHMADKPELMRVLKTAIERVQAENIAEFEKHMADIARRWAATEEALKVMIAKWAEEGQDS
jgi:hypothetical protein